MLLCVCCISVWYGIFILADTSILSLCLRAPWPILRISCSAWTASSSSVSSARRRLTARLPTPKLISNLIILFVFGRTLKIIRYNFWSTLANPGADVINKIKAKCNYSMLKWSTLIGQNKPCLWLATSNDSDLFQHSKPSYAMLKFVCDIGLQILRSGKRLGKEGAWNYRWGGLPLAAEDWAPFAAWALQPFPSPSLEVICLVLVFITLLE